MLLLLTIRASQSEGNCLKILFTWIFFWSKMPKLWDPSSRNWIFWSYISKQRIQEFLLLHVLVCHCRYCFMVVAQGRICWSNLFPMINLAMSISMMKEYWRGKGAFLVLRSGMMQLTSWAENKSQVLIYAADACAKSANFPGEAWELS